MKKYMIIKAVMLAVCIVLFAITLTACSGIDVIWLDADGTTLYTETISKDGVIPEKELPEDSDEWDYTEWKKIVSTDKTVTFLADRIASYKAIWEDFDGTVLEAINIPNDEKPPQRALPDDTEIWHYTGWTERREGHKYIFTAEREPQKDYFAGNVFQIVIKDLAGTPLGVGTGFVINKDGWFITCAQVMKNAYEATAIFEIWDIYTKKSYTELEIEKAAYINHDTDIFVGILSGYGRIDDHYNDIPFKIGSSVGDVTYSVGYPSNATSMEFHRGQIVSDMSSLSKELKSGITYVASDSYLGSGSIGGILINEDLKVIGMTAKRALDGNKEFVVGATIEARNYTAVTSNVKSYPLQDIAFMLHPTELTFIKFFRYVSTSSLFNKVTDGDQVYYEYKKTGSDINSNYVFYNYTTNLRVYPNKYISYTQNYKWDSGQSRSVTLSGYYYSHSDLNNFVFDFRYWWEKRDGKSYFVHSDNINYHKNVNLTLKDYTTESFNHNIPDSDIKYAKERFNHAYEYLRKIIDTYK